MRGLVGFGGRMTVPHVVAYRVQLYKAVARPAANHPARDGLTAAIELARCRLVLVRRNKADHGKVKECRARVVHLVELKVGDLRL